MCYACADSATPACEQPGGCCIFEDATDPLVNAFVADFLAAKELSARTNDARAGAVLFEKWDLYASPYVWLELERIFATWTTRQRT